ncbi:MBL fold metallo-hydrolase [Caldimonas tepidiphila]|uniref:MBL fold metallo-hydrolase n=1 Tax=Caldimonas tepidiphila TaxID=2315841 RepID=UPI000E5ABF85|nr:MBL fold metallo-hydrolase [Caldimonas tepidiphila]
MRFCSLGSGSTGNATLVECRSGRTVTRVLVDCGLSLRELSRRLGALGLAPDAIDAVFITHEHGDHVGCAATLARRHGTALWTSRGTWEAIGEPELPTAPNFAADGEEIAVGDLKLSPYAVPHDAREPLQLCIGDGASRLGLLTDAGESTPRLVEALQHCDALLLECNHDRALLAGSRYPAFLKARIAGSHGHLSNDSAAEILGACLHPGLRHVLAAHLSRENNTPALAAEALAAVLGCAAGEVPVADPITGSGWLSLR